MKRRLTACALAVFGLASYPATAGEPAFRLGFRCPEVTTGTAQEAVRYTATCTLATEGLAPGSAGAQGWSQGITSAGSCRVVLATTAHTAADRVDGGGFRSGGFENTQLVDPDRNQGQSGVVSAVILSNTKPITLPPGEVHDTLRLIVEADVSPEGDCRSCGLRYTGDLRGPGEVVPLVVSYEDQSVEPEVEPCETRVCALPCFEAGSTLDWTQWLVGDAEGTARLEDGLFRICASGTRLDAPEDGVVTLSQTVPGGDFDLVAELAELRGPGAAGLEARLFTGTFSVASVPRLEVSVRQSPQNELLLHSSLRESKGARPARLAEPVPIELPVVLGIRRRGERVVTTYGPPGQELRTHAELEAGRVPPAVRAGMLSTSLGRRVGPNDMLATAVAAFRDPSLTLGDPEAPRPRVTRTPVLETTPRLGEPTRIILEGANLGEVTGATVAGAPAELTLEDEGRLRLTVPPFDRPVRGDIVLESPTGDRQIPNAFFAFGEPWARCDCDGNGQHDISDAIKNLGYLFLGTAPCVCPAAGDCNGDGRRDITDAISLLDWLFVGGVPLPPPFPDPGTSDDPTETCVPQEELPAVTGISTQTIREGDVFTVEGRFPGDPENLAVVAGDAQLRILDSTPEELTVQADSIIGTESVVDVGVIRDFVPIPLHCFPRKCYPVFIGPVLFGDGIPVELIRSQELELVAQSTREDDGTLVVQFDKPIKPVQPVPGQKLVVEANLPLPVVSGVSPGARRLSFQPTFPRSLQDGGGAGVREELFDEALISLADQLQMELLAGSPFKDIIVNADTETRSLRIELSPELKEAIGPTARFPDGVISVFFDVGRCGPDDLHPIDDERDFGWCRIEEITGRCSGLPAFEWWFTKADTITSDANPFPLTHPNERTRFDKSVMYNRSAYCHIRKHALWNNCSLDELIADGFSEIPDFPKSAWVVKTSWTDSLPPEADPDDFYSYVYDGPGPQNGTRYYLLALHHTTKDIDNWVWLDLYPSFQDLGSGIGGCGGTNVDVPGGVDAPFSGYDLCTNVTHEQPLSTSGVAGVGPTATENSAHCGNFRFSPECLPPQDGTPGDTCMNCHDAGTASSAFGGRSRYTNSDGSIDLDFLFSLQNGLQDPDPCASVASASFSSDVLPILQTNCGCHTGGGGVLPESMNLVGSASTVHGQIVGVNAVESSLDRIEPGSPTQSYLWRKINDTHESVGSGDPMPPPPNDPLSPGQRGIIEDWIDDGAPNN